MKYEIVKENNHSKKQEQEQTFAEQPKWTLEEIALSKKNTRSD